MSVNDKIVSGCLVDIVLHGTIVDLVDAALRVENSSNNRVWAWIDSSSAYFAMALKSGVRFVHDFALALFHLLLFPFKRNHVAMMNIVVYSGRSLIDLLGIVGGIAGTIYPPALSRLALYVLSQLRTSTLEELADGAEEFRNGLNGIKGTVFFAGFKI